MPGFFDRVKSGAEKAAFEADKLRRVSQAQSALKGLQAELETQLGGLGRQALALYDAGTLTQPELLAFGPALDALRAKIAAQEAEVERIRQERQPGEAPAAPAPSAPGAAPAAPVAPATPVAPAAPVAAPPPRPAAMSANEEAAPEAEGRKCPSCGQAVPEGVKFCPECGAKL